MNPFDKITARLENFKERKGNGEFSRHGRAQCPSCGGKTDKDKLSITEKNDGVVLIHCFAGCVDTDILIAIGLTERDLYPHQPHQPKLNKTVKGGVKGWDWWSLVAALNQCSDQLHSIQKQLIFSVDALPVDHPARSGMVETVTLINNLIHGIENGKNNGKNAQVGG